MKKYITLTIVIISLALQSCVQEEHQKTITFSVDMNEVENVANVGIRGDFTERAWKETIPLKDEDGDGIYTLTISRKTATHRISFKFVNQGSEYELKDQENRDLIFIYQPETIEYITKFNNNKEVIVNRK